MIKSLVGACTLTSILFIVLPFLLLWDVYLLILQRALGLRRHTMWVALALAVVSVVICLHVQMGFKSIFSERSRSDSNPPFLSYQMQITFSFLSLFETFVISSLTALLSISCMLAKCVTVLLTMPYLCALLLITCICIHLNV